MADPDPRQADASAAPLLDRPGAVRAGEELDPERLRVLLAPALGLAPTDPAPLELAQFRRGYSNLTYFVRWAGHQVVLRRPPFGSEVRSAHDMVREHRLLTALHGNLPVPRPLAVDTAGAALGAPGYAMERVEGVILRGELPPGLTLDASTKRAIDGALVDQLAALHRLDPAALALAELGRPEGYVARQVAGWSGRWRAAETAPVPEIDALIPWLAAHQLPAEPVRRALVHNDFKHDNLVLDPGDLTRVRAILDWEMATVGDPLLDLATTLGYWVEAGDEPVLRRFRFAPTDLPGSLTRREVVARYEEATGQQVPRPDFLYAFGLFKVAVIAQQIYKRYRQGLTRDERFAALPAAIGALAAQAARVMASGTV
jgi:aminoglycoside phosphotransferase (APT) family kinase protein